MIQAEYYRFTRLGGSGTVTITVAASAIRDGTVDLWWDSSYLGEMKVNGVTPEPDSATTVDGRIRYRFAAEPRDGPFDVTFDLAPDGMGSTRAEIAVAEGTEHLTYDQFVYP